MGQVRRHIFLLAVIVGELTTLGGLAPRPWAAIAYGAAAFVAAAIPALIKR